MAQSYHRSQRLPARTGQFTSAAYIRSLHILHPVATFELPAGRIHPLMFPAAWLTGTGLSKGCGGLVMPRTWRDMATQRRDMKPCRHNPVDSRLAPRQLPKTNSG